MPTQELLIRFIQGVAWDSKLIEARTGAWCSHVEYIPLYTTDPTLTLGAQLKGGVAWRSISDPVYAGLKRWEIWHVPCTQDVYDRFQAFMVAQIGKPYDWRAIASIAAWWASSNWRNSDAWYCSELILAACEAAGLFTIPTQLPVTHLDPGDAYLLITTQPGAYK